MSDARIARLQALIERLRQAVRDGDVDVMAVRDTLRALRAEGVDTASALEAARAVVATQRGIQPASTGESEPGNAVFRLSPHDVALLEACGISPSRRRSGRHGGRGAR